MSNENKPNYEVKIPLEVNGNWEYFPIYNPPNATGETSGDVTLSDNYIGDNITTLDKNSSIAFTPKGANDLYKNVLSKVDEDSQRVTGPVEFNGPIEFNNTTYFWKTAEFGKGSDDVDSLVHFRKPFTLKIGLSNVDDGLKATGTIEMNSQPVTVNIDSMALPAGNLTGTVPLKCIPQGAIETLIPKDSLDAAIDEYKKAADDNKPYQIGDTILDNKTKIMYIAKGPDLTKKENYVEYASGTAMKLGATTVGSETQPIYLNLGSPEVITNIAVAYGGTGGSNVKEASANLKYTNLSSRSNVPNKDLNEVRIAGSYFDNGSVVESNLPSTKKYAYNLEVFENTDGTVRQQLRYYNDFNIWERIYKETEDNNLPQLTNNWTSWHSIGESSSGANTSLIVIPGKAEGLTSNNFIVAPDNTSESEKIIQVSPASTQDTNAFTYTLNHLPLGAYSIIIRSKVSSLTEANLLNISVSSNSGGSVWNTLKNINIQGAYYQKVNTWESMSFGVNLTGTRTSKFRIDCMCLKNNDTSIQCEIDYIRIMPSGTALGSIG